MMTIQDYIYTSTYVVMIIWFIWNIIITTIKYKKESRIMVLNFKRTMRFMYKEHKLKRKILLDKEKFLNELER
jgi:hypothetical protein